MSAISNGVWVDRLEDERRIATESERAAIVAWLREQGREWIEISSENPNRNGAAFQAIRGDNCKHLATAIERGEHLKGDGRG